MELELNNRELAVLMWVAGFSIWALTHAEIRKNLRRVVIAFFHPKVVGWVVVVAAFSAGTVWAAAELGLWDSTLINDTVVWFFSGAVVLLFGATRFASEPRHLRRVARQALTAGVLAEGMINLYVFPLFAELILFPVVSLLVMALVVAEAKEEYALLAKLLSGLLMTVGLTLIIYAASHALADSTAAGWAHNARALALPLWLTLTVLPVVYVVGLHAAYDSTFSRIEFLAERMGTTRRARRRAKIALFCATHLRAREVGGFVGPWPKRLVSAPSFRDAQAVLAGYVAERRSGEAA